MTKPAIHRKLDASQLSGYNLSAEYQSVPVAAVGVRARTWHGPITRAQSGGRDPILVLALVPIYCQGRVLRANTVENHVVANPAAGQRWAERPVNSHAFTEYRREVTAVAVSSSEQKSRWPIPSSIRFLIPIPELVTESELKLGGKAKPESGSGYIRIESGSGTEMRNGTEVEDECLDGIRIERKTGPRSTSIDTEDGGVHLTSTLMELQTLTV
ncbi:hypothetical protein EVAR_58989_1 [Eumeta japonica]|uniref:Uncharacterized protein n=1 Tax=Eumeta variegata TaxID=151549 RepID=A0A4C1YEN2_EUMVA|nr:hypothetical protein EVAR_58989_1 [Eumeta japonica]